MNVQRKTVWAAINPKVQLAAKQVARIQGITLSEYVRTLVLADLDRRGCFVLKDNEAQDAQKSQAPAEPAPSTRGVSPA